MPAPAIDTSGLSDAQIANFAALECHIDNIIHELLTDPGQPQHLQQITSSMAASSRETML